MSEYEEKIESYRRLHTALGEHVAREGEIVTKWVCIVEVAGVDGQYLATRSGGGAEGIEQPTSWEMLGLLHSAMVDAEDDSVAARRIIGEDGDIEELDP